MDRPPRLTPRGSVYIIGNGPADAALVGAFSSYVVDKGRSGVVYYHC